MAYKRRHNSKLALVIIFFFVISAFIPASSQLVFAQAPSPAYTPYANNKQDYTLLQPLPCIPDAVNTCPGGAGAPMTTVNMSTFFQYAFNLLIAGSAVAAVFMIVWGGFLYVTTDSWFTKNQGWGYFTNAIYGLLMILGAYLILRTVNPKLVAFPTSIPTITVPNQSASNPVDFFTQINTDATNYTLAAQQAVNSAKQAQTNTTTLTTQRDALQSQLDELSRAVGPDDPDVKALQVQIAGLNDKIKNSQASVQTNMANFSFANDTAQTLQDIGVKDANNNPINGTLNSNVTADYINSQITSGVQAIERDRQTRDDALTQAGSYDQISRPGGVDDSANAAKLALQLQGIDAITSKATVLTIGTKGYWGYQVVAQVGSQDVGTVSKENSTLNSQLSAISSQISSIKDPTLQNNLKTQLTTVQNNVNQKFVAKP